MVEAQTVLPHLQVQGLFARVGEGGVPDIVRQGERFGEVFVQSEGTGNGPRNLRNLNRVGEPIAKMIGEGGSKDLGFIFQAAECPGMNHAVTVPLKQAAIRMHWLRIAPTTRLFHRKTEVGQHRVFCLFLDFADFLTCVRG